MALKFNKLIFIVLMINGLIQYGSAHSFDPNAVMRYGEVHLATDTVALMYVLELGSNEYIKVYEDYDLDQNNRIHKDELQSYLNDISEDIQAAQTIQINGESIPLKIVKKNAYNALGHHNADTIRSEVGLIGSLPSDLTTKATVSFVYEDQLWTKNPGWKQLRFIPHNGVSFSGHIPYSDINAFDTKEMGNPDFMPSTNELNLEIQFPGPNDQSPQVVDLKMLIENHPMFNSGFAKQEGKSFAIYWIIAGIVLVIGGGLVAKQKGWIE